MTRMSMVIVVATAALLALAGPVIAGGGGGLCAGFTEGEEVGLRDSCLDGTAHFTASGKDLTVVNHGQGPHDYTAVDGSFTTGSLAPGETATIQALDVGVHRVRCTLHSDVGGQGMAGVLIVGAVSPDTLAAAHTAADAALATDEPLGIPWTGWLVNGGMVGLLLVGVLALLRRRKTAAGP